MFWVNAASMYTAGDNKLKSRYAGRVSCGSQQEQRILKTADNIEGQ